MKPLTVGLTHGTPTPANWPQTAGAFRPATTVRARNAVALESLGTEYVNAPFARAETVAMRLVPARIVTRVATPAPPWTTRPARRLTPLTFRPESVIPPGAIAAGGRNRGRGVGCADARVPRRPERDPRALHDRAEDACQRQVGAQELRAEGGADRGRQVRRREADHELCGSERRLGAGRRDDVGGQVDRLPGRLQHE